MRYFPYIVGVLDLGAAVVYAFNREWRLALIWFLYGIASIALGGLK